MGRSRNARLIACSVFITLYSAVTAYYRAFVGLAPYDDEGALMMTIKRFLDGDALYDRIATIYGPVYYFYEWCAHALTGLPISHDSVRFVSAAFWVAAGLMVFLLIYRATGSLAVAAMTHILAFRMLRFIGDEPAHPQEACIFLLMALGVACYAANPTLRMALLGALTGAMAATKINLGIFVVIALAVGFAFALRPGWLRTAASIAASIGALAFPVMLMSGHIAESWAARFCALVVISMASVILAISRMEWEIPIRVRDLLVWGLGCVGAIAAICSFPLMHGSTVHGMVDMLLIKPRTSFGQVWFVPVPVGSLALVSAAAGLVCAWYMGTKRASSSLIAMAKLAFAAGVILLAVRGRQVETIGFATPFLWLVAVRPGEVGTGGRHSLARALLGLVGVAQVLYAYPVGGSQVRFVMIFMIAIAGICLWDGVSWVRATLSEWTAQWQSPRVIGAIQVAVGVSLAAVYLVSAWHARESYEAYEPLALSGAQRTRVNPERAAALRALVGMVNSSSCGTLVTEPGLFSLNLWTGKPAPEGLTEAWMVFLSDAEQESIVREVSRDPHACVIQRPDIARMWARGTDVSSQPLIRFIREGFRTVFEIEGDRFMVRKP